MQYSDLPFNPTVRVSQKDVDRTRRKLTTYANKLMREFEGLPWELGRIAQAYARSIAPVMTGTLLRAIQFRTNQRSVASLVVDKATLNSNPTNYLNVNYAAIMHEKNGDMGRGVHIHSGDPRFMFTTRDYILEKLGREVRIKLGKISQR